MEESVKTTTIFLIYIGRNMQGLYLFLVLNKIEDNDGKSVTNLKLEPVGFKTSTFNNKTVGAIFSVETSNGGKTFLYNKKNMAAGYWGNKEDKAMWQISNKAATLHLSGKKEGQANEYEKILSPIRDAYAKAGSGNERSLILAEVIRLVTRTTYR